MIELPAFLDGTAQCAQHDDPDLWHSGLTADEQKAKQICHNCPLRPACADHALTRPEERGTWGGLTAKERSRLLRPNDPTWIDDEGRVRVPCGSYKALLAHISYKEECEECRDAQAARTKDDRLSRLAREHEVGGTVTGARIHRLLGEPTCMRCRAAVARQSAAQREARQAGEQRPALALAS